MVLKYKPDFEECRKYWQAFWMHEVIDRPCICVNAPKDGMLPKPETPYMSGADGHYDHTVKLVKEWAEATYFGGESLPHFVPSFGPDQFSSFLGAELEMVESGSTSWVSPFVTDWDDIKLDLATDKKYGFKKMQELIRYLTERGQGEFLVGMLDFHGSLDCLSAIRGPGNLCMDLIDCPDKVEKVLMEVRAFYLPLLNEIIKAGDMDNRGYIGWAPTYCEGRFAVTQCDFMCMIGPEHARRFVLPALEEELSYLDHSVFHLDGKEALVHLDDILAMPKIDVIQWVPSAGKPRTIEWMELLRKIQKAGKGLWIFDWTVDEIKKYNKELRQEGLIYQVNASSQKEAEGLVEWLRKNT